MDSRRNTNESIIGSIYSDTFSNSSRSSISSTSSLKSIKSFSKVKRFRWYSTNDFLLLSVASTITIHRLFNFAVPTGKMDDPTIIHYIFGYIFVGLPMVYMEVFIGQYTQLGFLHFKYLTPLAHGLGYAVTLMTALKSMLQSIIMADVFMYLLSSMQSELPWMRCPEGMNVTVCWDVDSDHFCNHTCITGYNNISTMVYWKKIFMNDVDLNPTSISLGVPLVARVVMLIFTWAIIYLIALSGLKKFINIVVLCEFISFGISVVMIVVLLVTPGSVQGITNMFTPKLTSLFSPVAWSVVVYDIFNVMAVCRVCLMIYGSYLLPKSNAETLAVVVVICNCVGYFMGSVISNASLGIIAHYGRISMDKVAYIDNTGSFPYLTTIPQALCFLGVPQMWTILFFLALVLLSLCGLVTNIDCIERVISDGHPKLAMYRDYTLAVTCLVSLILCIPLTSKEMYVLLDYMVDVNIPNVLSFDVTFMAVFVFWIYGVQRLSDDVHFMTKEQPSVFWKFCWYIMPCVAMSEYFVYSFSPELAHYYRAIRNLRMLLYFLFVSPIPILVGYQLFKFAKAQNLIGLIHPAERWGHPDHEERQLRYKFNPREETHSRRRDNTCKHKCLLDSKILMRAIQIEKDLREGSVGNVLMTDTPSFNLLDDDQLDELQYR